MSTYENNRKTLNKIRQEFGCKGDVIFRTAIQYVVEFGQEMFRDEEWVKDQLDKVDVKHNVAEAEGKNLWIGREFEKTFIECAAEVAKVNAYDLLIYIQKEVFWSNEGGIDYERAVDLLKACMSNIEMWNDCQCVLTLHEFEDIGFDDDEIIELGFGYLLDGREDEYED